MPSGLSNLNNQLYNKQKSKDEKSRQVHAVAHGYLSEIVKDNL